MVFVLTADQRDSRHYPDAVDDVLAALAEVIAERPFERTAGDELQGVLAEPLSVAQAIIVLMDTGQWHVGIGVGPVDTPLPASTRAGRGPAFIAARDALERAKRRTSGVEVGVPDETAPDETAPDEAESDETRSGEAAVGSSRARAARDATTGCQLLADLLTRRTRAGHDAVRLVRAGLTQEAAAQHLGITRQAVNQRLAAARWHLERDGLAMVAHLLERVDAMLEPAGTAPQ